MGQSSGKCPVSAVRTAEQATPSGPSTTTRHEKAVPWGSPSSSTSPESPEGVAIGVSSPKTTWAGAPEWDCHRTRGTVATPVDAMETAIRSSWSWSWGPQPGSPKPPPVSAVSPGPYPES